MDAEDDKIGYGRPPQHSRFAKGRSGNPKGRPKGSPNVKTAIRKAIDRRVAVKIGKKTVKMHPIDAMAHRLVQQALDGNLKAMRELMDLGGLRDEFATSVQRASTLGKEDFDLLRRALARHDAPTTHTADPESSGPDRLNTMDQHDV
jgi:hypothetical protein